MAIAGRVALVPKGEWSQSVTYDKLDLVTYNGNTFIAYKSSVGVTPVDGDTWMLVLEGIDPQDIENIIDGTTPVGDSNKLGGKGASEYVQKTGDSTIDGNIEMKSNGNAHRMFTMSNPLRTIQKVLFKTDGTYYEYDVTNGKYIYKSNADGANTFYGVATECLPLTGSEQSTIKRANAIPISVENTQTNSTASYIGFKVNNAMMGRLGFSSASKPTYVPADGQSIHELLHTGNKPTGTYTGNGSATQRIITIGGIGNVVKIHNSSNNDNAFVTVGGYIGKQGNTVVCGKDTYVKNGTIVMSTSSSVFNESGVTYTYELL
jgi:hypothetical protein